MKSIYIFKFDEDQRYLDIEMMTHLALHTQNVHRQNHRHELNRRKWHSLFGYCNTILSDVYKMMCSIMINEETFSPLITCDKLKNVKFKNGLQNTTSTLVTYNDRDSH